METLEVQPYSPASEAVVSEVKRNGARSEDYDIVEFGYKSELEVCCDISKYSRASPVFIRLRGVSACGP